MLAIIAKGDFLKGKVGRPTFEKAFRVRTKAWFFAVCQASGMNAEELEIFFAPPDKQAKYRAGVRPRLWEKYRDKYVAPKSKPTRKEGKLSIVEKVEKSFPGTSQWITMPFWQVLRPAPMEMHELKDIYWNLADPVRELIVMEGPREEKEFWRRPVGHDELYKRLASIGDIDAATAILALIKEAETTQNQLQHRDGLKCWAKCAKQLRKHPVLSLVMDDINAIIADRYTRICYAGEDGKYYSMTEEEVHTILPIEKHALDQGTSRDNRPTRYRKRMRRL